MEASPKLEQLTLRERTVDSLYTACYIIKAFIFNNVKKTLDTIEYIINIIRIIKNIYNNKSIVIIYLFLIKLVTIMLFNNLDQGSGNALVVVRNQGETQLY